MPSAQQEQDYILQHGDVQIPNMTVREVMKKHEMLIMSGETRKCCICLDPPTLPPFSSHLAAIIDIFKKSASVTSHIIVFVLIFRASQNRQKWFTNVWAKVSFVCVCFPPPLSKKKLCALYGKWTECLYVVEPATFETHKKNDKKGAEEKKSSKAVWSILSWTPGHRFVIMSHVGRKQSDWADSDHIKTSTVNTVVSINQHIAMHLEENFVHFHSCLQGCSDDQEEVPSPTADTVQMIPGSQLLWRIAPRPANSTQVWLTHSQQRRLKTRRCFELFLTCGIFSNSRCTASRPLQCSWMSCTRRWRESFLRQTAGSGRIYEPWRTVISVI